MTDYSRQPDDIRLSELAPYGFSIMDDPDRRGLPCSDQIAQGLDTIVEGVSELFTETRLEDELAPILWQITNLFHRRIEKAERSLDTNEVEQKRMQLEQDGSEVKSVELEDKITQGQNLIEARNVFELLRDNLADRYFTETGSTWRPMAGRMVNHTTMTSAMLESRDFMQAREKTENSLNMPSGTYILFAGSKSFNEIERIETVLNSTLEKFPDMVLCHTNMKSGADKIAIAWAKHKNIPAVGFSPEFTKFKNAAPFKRNDAMLTVEPKGLIAIPDNGIVNNLVQKATAMGLKTKCLSSTE